MEPRRHAGVDAEAGRITQHRHQHADAAPVLGRDDPRVRSGAPGLPLQLHPREGRQHAENAGRGGSGRCAGRPGPPGHQLRFLRQALRLRQGRLCAAVCGGSARGDIAAGERQQALTEPPVLRRAPPRAGFFYAHASQRFVVCKDLDIPVLERLRCAIRPAPPSPTSPRCPHAGWTTISTATSTTSSITVTLTRP
ncbi:unnamed protein product [Rhizophagus irregularis]|nr:unnamed protein product [Rhizophagus irregularis]